MIPRLLTCLLFLAAMGAGPGLEWKTLGQGLWLAGFQLPEEDFSGKAPIRVLKIDPSQYRFRLLSASEERSGPATAREWAEKHGLAAAINASMYRKDKPLVSTGYMKNYRHFNNPSKNRRYGAYFLANPADPSLAPARIVDSRAKDARELLGKYQTVIQNYRMVGEGRKNAWSAKSTRISTIACIGQDTEGNILFIHSRGPYRVRDFIDILLSLPLNLEKAMYVEGGSEATLYIEQEDRTGSGMNPVLSFFGGPGLAPWPLPNVLGIEKK